MQKITERGKPAGLLDPEQARDLPRSQRVAERADIPDSRLEENVYPEEAETRAGEPFPRDRRRVAGQRASGRRRSRSKFQSRFSWGNRWVRISAVLLAAAALGVVAAATWEIKSVILHNPRFHLQSIGNIQVTGNRVVAASEVARVFAPDTGRSIFRLPLAKRAAELENIPWVRRATVMRLWPDRVTVRIDERSPIAFARDGDTIRLVDEQGVLLDLPQAAAQHYSFPVLNGISSSEPLSMRAARVAAYREFVSALDADGDNVSATLSEVNLLDPEDIRAVFTGGARQPLVHFGDKDFLPRYRAYQAHLAEWLQQYPGLRSVDMRYGRQVVLDTGTQSSPSAGTPGAADTASAAQNKAVDLTSDRTSVNKNSVVKSRTKAGSAKKTVRSTHHRNIHRRPKPRVPERGHRVRDPIMHVVTGI